MREMSVNRFRSGLKAAVEGVVKDHVPLRVTRRSGEDFVVISAADWDRAQETLFVLRNRPLMKQIGRSLETHREGKGPQAQSGTAPP
jgi:antitoxin YefM